MKFVPISGERVVVYPAVSWLPTLAWLVFGTDPNESHLQSLDALCPKFRLHSPLYCLQALNLQSTNPFNCATHSQRSFVALGAVENESEAGGCLLSNRQHLAFDSHPWMKRCRRDVGLPPA